MSAFATDSTLDDNPDFDIIVNSIDPIQGENTRILIGTRLILVKRFCGDPQPLFSEWVISGFSKDNRLIVTPLRSLRLNGSRLVDSNRLGLNFVIKGFSC